jgi:hypothetical protein
VLVTDASMLNTSADYVNWVSQYGPDHTSVLQNFYVGSTMGDFIKGHLDYGKGTIAVAGTDWKNATAVNDSANTADPGISAKDDLLWTNDGLSGTGPLTLTFNNSPVYGAGAFIQADGFATFTARIQAFSGFNTVLDMMVTSDSKGDAVFLGVSDDTQEITRIVYSIVNAPRGMSPGDFAIDTLYIQNGTLAAPLAPPATTVPEPGMFSLVGIALTGMGLYVRRATSRV